MSASVTSVKGSWVNTSAERRRSIPHVPTPIRRPLEACRASSLPLIFPEGPSPLESPGRAPTPQLTTRGRMHWSRGLGSPGKSQEQTASFCAAVTEFFIPAPPASHSFNCSRHHRGASSVSSSSLVESVQPSPLPPHFPYLLHIPPRRTSRPLHFRYISGRPSCSAT